jgi:hypothetical protein
MTGTFNHTADAEVDSTDTRPPNQWRASEIGQAFDQGSLLEYSVERLVDIYDRLRRVGGKIIEHSNRAE